MEKKKRGMEKNPASKTPKNVEALGRRRNRESVNCEERRDMERKKEKKITTATQVPPVKTPATQVPPVKTPATQVPPVKTPAETPSERVSEKKMSFEYYQNKLMFEYYQNKLMGCRLHIVMTLVKIRMLETDLKATIKFNKNKSSVMVVESTTKKPFLRSAAAAKAKAKKHAAAEPPLTDVEVYEKEIRESHMFIEKKEKEIQQSMPMYEVLKKLQLAIPEPLTEEPYPDDAVLTEEFVVADGRKKQSRGRGRSATGRGRGSKANEQTRPQISSTVLSSNGQRENLSQEEEVIYLRLRVASLEEELRKAREEASDHGKAVSSPVIEPVGNPSECLLLKNMFDPNTETDPDFDMDIKHEVEEECSTYGHVKHIFVDKNSAGYVYLRFETVAASAGCQRAMHMRWFARRLISAIFMQPYEYEAKFVGGH